MAGGILKEQPHFKLSSQRSLEAAATEKGHRRAVNCRRVVVFIILFSVVSFIAFILGSILYTKVEAQLAQETADAEAYASTDIGETTRGGMRGGRSAVTGIALATLRDLQEMHSSGLSAIKSLRAVVFELNNVPQLKTINRIERSGETYTLHFNKGKDDALVFTANTFVYINAEGKNVILTPGRRRG